MQFLINATFLTQDDQHPIVGALAIDQGIIIAVGEKEEIMSIPTREKNIVDLQGLFVLPGFTDSHIHLGYYSRSLQKINLDGLSRQECINQVADAAKFTPPDTWILGHGWDHNHWPEGYGNAAMLDEVAPDHPVFLTVKSLHAAWANNKALAMAGINVNTKNPPGGSILRNQDGTPSGILLESAYPLVEKIIPEPSPIEMAEMLDATQQQLWRLGLTSVHDFDQQLILQGLQILHQQNKLKLRIIKNLHAHQINAIRELGLVPGFGDDMLRLGSLKYFADGAIGPQTAAMFETFTNSDSLGEMLFTPQELDEIYQTATKLSFSVAMHAIGDRANHLVLNAIEKIRRKEKEMKMVALPHRIEHAQILKNTDIKRFKELQVIASMQPYHLSMDIHTTDTALAGRGIQSFLFKSMLDLQVPLIFGSDAPVVDPNPFLGIFAAVARKNRTEDPVWFPQESLTVQQAIKSYTIHPPRASAMQDQMGKLARGYKADMIILDKNPVKIHINEMKKCLPVATIVGGDWVYSKIT
ncbi:MAG: amidohydrolase [Anaerolineaceae bacterium]|nr:amidohydrolase [Anaerolineaceae bacterium]